MTGPRQDAQPARFYKVSLEDHLRRSIDRFVGLRSLRAHLADVFSHTGRPPVDPDPLIRMLVVGDFVGIRSERRMCEEVHPNLAYRWFCRRDLGDRVPDHSTFSKNRHGRFRDSDLFDTTVARSIVEAALPRKAPTTWLMRSARRRMTASMPCPNNKREENTEQHQHFAVANFI